MESDSEIVNNFDSDQEEHHEENEENILEYNQNEFQFEKIYQKLTDIHLLQKEFKCDKCGKTMVMVKDNSTIDKKIFDVGEIIQNMILKLILEKIPYMKSFKFPYLYFII